MNKKDKKEKREWLGWLFAWAMITADSIYIEFGLKNSLCDCSVVCVLLTHVQLTHYDQIHWIKRKNVLNQVVSDNKKRNHQNQ